LSEAAVARTHVVMSDEVLEAIDEVAGKRGRSRFLEAAAKASLERVELERAIHDSFGIARGRGYEHWRDRKATEEWVRSVRRTDER